MYEPLGMCPWRRRCEAISERSMCVSRSKVDSHEQAGLAASTVTHNDQLATDFRHLRDNRQQTLLVKRSDRRKGLSMHAAAGSGAGAAGDWVVMREGWWRWWSAAVAARREGG